MELHQPGTDADQGRRHIRGLTVYDYHLISSFSGALLSSSVFRRGCGHFVTSQLVLMYALGISACRELEYSLAGVLSLSTCTVTRRSLRCFFS
jgi:hypothetical protein